MHVCNLYCPGLSNGISIIKNRCRRRISKGKRRIACILFRSNSQQESARVSKSLDTPGKRTIILGMGLFQIEAQKGRVVPTVIMRVLQGRKRRSENHTQAQQAISTCMIPKLTKDHSLSRWTQICMCVGLACAYLLLVNLDVLHMLQLPWKRNRVKRQYHVLRQLTTLARAPLLSWRVNRSRNDSVRSRQDVHKTSTKDKLR